ncbi:Uncharacterised protein [uncultured archaeon]|nr:Uncharacterised protein [uncultured archaeon]
MAKKSYKRNQVIGKNLSRPDLDQIAANDGYPVFIQGLGLGNSLYANKNEDKMRIYSKTGDVIVREYTPKGRLQNTFDFQNPIACLPANLSNYGFRQYTGNGRVLSVKKS